MTARERQEQERAQNTQEHGGKVLRLRDDMPNTPKPLAPFAGSTLVEHVLAAVAASGLRPVCCVVSDDRVAAVVPGGVIVVRNPEPELGISTSLRAVLEVLADDPTVDAVVVGLADQPLVGPEVWLRVAAASAPMVAATYGGRRANPVRLDREVWAEAMGLRGDEGARALIRRHGAAEVACDDAGDPSDADTPDDLAVMERRWRSQTASG